MPLYEVEVCFEVEATDEDDAVFKVRKVLDPVEVTLASGVKRYFTYDECAHEMKEDE